MSILLDTRDLKGGVDIDNLKFPIDYLIRIDDIRIFIVQTQNSETLSSKVTLTLYCGKDIEIYTILNKERVHKILMDKLEKKNDNWLKKPRKINSNKIGIKKWTII